MRRFKLSQKKSFFKILLLNFSIVSFLAIALIWASSAILTNFTKDYYDEMIISTTERFNHHFNVLTDELEGLVSHAETQERLLSRDRLEKRAGLLDLIRYSNMVDYGLVINEDQLIEVSVFHGTVGANDIDETEVVRVDEPSLERARMIAKPNLLEYIIPLPQTNEQLHLFIDLSINQTMQSFFQSISFANDYYLAILDRAEQPVYTYNALANPNPLDHLKPLVHETLNQTTHPFEPRLMHDETSGYAVSHQTLARTDWHLLLIVPEHLSQQFISDLNQLLLPVLIGLSVLLFLVISIVTYRNQRPYQQLLTAIQAVSSGDYQHRIDAVNPNQQIGSINQQFNEMVHQLEQYRYDVFKKEDSLQRQKAFLDRIINTSPTLIYTMTVDGRYTMVNNSYASVYGLTPEEMVGKNIKGIKALMHRAKKDITINHHILDTHASMEYEDHHVGTNGVEHWYQVIKQPFLGLSGNETEILLIATDITTIREQQALIEHQVYHDELTAIGNRKLFKKQIKAAIDMSDQGNNSFAVMFLDLDRFKYVNDTFGHDAGDQLLIEVAHRIEATLGEKDQVFRFGGDEFTIIANYDESRLEINELANQLIRALTQPYLFDGHAFVVTASIGISLYPKHTQTINELTKFADLSMYQAKQQGKNTYRIYTKELQTEVSQAIRLETDLYQAVARDEILVKYQPIFSKDTQALVAVEALIRWEHSKLGLISPQTFLPISEQNGLIHSIGLSAIKDAINTVAEYNQQHTVPIDLHINLSETQLLNMLTHDRIEQLTNDYGLATEHLVIEVEETLVTKLKSPVQKILMMYQTSGFRIAIDHFDENYITSQKLKRLPVNVIKISQTVLNDLLDSTADLAAFQRMIEHAHTLNIRVIQEGIETEEQARYLLAYPIDAWQGFLFSQPLTKDYFKQLY